MFAVLAKERPDITRREAADKILAAWPDPKPKADSIKRYISGVGAVGDVVARYFEVESGPEPEVAPEDAWADLAAKNKDTIARGLSQSRATIRINDDRPVGVAFFTDGHIGSGGTDMERMEYDAKIARETDGLYVIQGGDAVDNFIFPKMMRPAMEAPLTPGKQYDLAEHYLEMFGDSILAMISGNHDQWTDRVAGIDVLGRLAKRRRILYDPDEFLITLKLAGQEYRVLIRHKAPFNSSINLTHVCKQLLRMGRYEVDPDIIALGHHHTPELDFFPYKGENRLAIRTGSYKVIDDYSRQHAFANGGYMVPTAILYPGRREIIGMPTLEAAADFLTYLRRRAT